MVTAYLLTSTAVTPLWGKLSDLYGRRGTFQAAIVIFLAGSMLSGLVQNMSELIAFRAAFAAWEARASEPILPLRLFRDPIFTVAGGITLLLGMALFGAVLLNRLQHNLAVLLPSEAGGRAQVDLSSLEGAPQQLRDLPGPVLLALLLRETPLRTTAHVGRDENDPTP